MLLLQPFDHVEALLRGRYGGICEEPPSSLDDCHADRDLDVQGPELLIKAPHLWGWQGWGGVRQRRGGRQQSPVNESAGWMAWEEAPGQGRKHEDGDVMT